MAIKVRRANKNVRLVIIVLAFLGVILATFIANVQAQSCIPLDIDPINWCCNDAEYIVDYTEYWCCPPSSPFWNADDNVCYDWNSNGQANNYYTYLSDCQKTCRWDNSDACFPTKCEDMNLFKCTKTDTWVFNWIDQGPTTSCGAECVEDSDCPPGYSTGDPYCDDESLLQDYYAPWCSDNECGEIYEPYIIEECDICDQYYHIFEDGMCVLKEQDPGCIPDDSYWFLEDCISNNTQINGTDCNTNVDCPADIIINERICRDGDIWKDSQTSNCLVGVCVESDLQDIIEECEQGCDEVTNVCIGTPDPFPVWIVVIVISIAIVIVVFVILIKRYNRR